MNDDITSLRLRNHRIEGRHYDSPEKVVAGLGALQAQDYHQAVWAIGIRTANATLADVERAIAGRRIVLTWAMRGTIHAVPAEDVRWMLQLTAPRILAGDARRMRQLELDEAILERCDKLLREALGGKGPLSRPAIMRLFEEAGIATASQRGYHILWRLAQAGLLCQGPLEGKQQTFALLDEWVPNARRLDPEQALAELARRYFAARGPATVHDFAWWAGLTLADARRGLEGAGSTLVSETLDGETYWSAEGPETNGKADGVHLLPGFDEYFLGYKDRSAAIDREREPLVVPGGNGVFKPIVVAGGRIVGVWQRKIGSKGIDIEVFPFGPPDVPDDELNEAALRYCRFQDKPLRSLKKSP